MQHRITIGAGLIAGVCLSLGAASSIVAAQQAAVQKGAAVMSHARGTFDVKVVPQAVEETPETAGLSRMSLDKQFHGDLEGTSKGEMLAGGVVKGSGGYVAMERVAGTLQGRTGSFML